MAQLKDLVVNGDSRIVGTLYVSKHNISNLNNAYPTRPTNCNIAATADGSGNLLHFKATSTMTSNKPAWDSHVLHFNWDNNEGYDTQLALGARGDGIQIRGQEGGTWLAWKTILHSSNYTSYTPVVFTGTAAPTASTGKNGDIYIQTS